jgi:hypothetical protein
MSNRIIITIAGTGDAAYSGDRADATLAKLRNPNGLAIDSNGNIYIADTDNNRIRRIATNGIITTIAGTGTPGYSGDGALATDAKLTSPTSVAVDSLNNVYIGDGNRIRKIAANGIITTFAGTGEGGYSGDKADATLAKLNGPLGVAVDRLNNVYIADQWNYRIRRIGTSGITNGIITTVAGNGDPGSSGDGGLAIKATLNTPNCVAVDGLNNVYFTEFNSYRIRKIDYTNPEGIITTIAGTGQPGSSGDGARATDAKLSFPTGVAVDRLNNVYIAEYTNNRIRKIDYNDPRGIITTIAGTGQPGFSGDGARATDANLSTPCGVAIDSNGNIYIADTNNNRIRKITDPIPTTMPNTTQPMTTQPNTTQPNTRQPMTTSATTQATTTIPQFTITATPSGTMAISTPAVTFIPVTTSTPPVTFSQVTTSTTTSAPTSIPPFVFIDAPTTTTIPPSESNTDANSLQYLHQYIASNDAKTYPGQKTLLDVRVEDSKELVMVQNNMLLIGTITLAVLVIGGIIVFDK